MVCYNNYPEKRDDPVDPLASDWVYYPNCTHRVCTTCWNIDSPNNQETYIEGLRGYSKRCPYGCDVSEASKKTDQEKCDAVARDFWYFRDVHDRKKLANKSYKWRKRRGAEMTLAWWRSYMDEARIDILLDIAKLENGIDPADGMIPAYDELPFTNETYGELSECLEGTLNWYNHCYWRIQEVEGLAFVPQYSRNDFNLMIEGFHFKV